MTLALQPRPRPSVLREFHYTHADYEMLTSAGVFEHLRIELFRGRLMQRPQITDGEAASLLRAEHELRRLFPDDAFTVRPGTSFVAADDSVPVPDLCLIAGDCRSIQTVPSACLLVVEISLAALAYDRAEKASLYAESGVGEYWIVNLVDRVVERHMLPVRRDDGTWGYASITTHGVGERCPVGAIDGASLDVAALLPAR